MLSGPGEVREGRLEFGEVVFSDLVCQVVVNFEVSNYQRREGGDWARVGETVLAVAVEPHTL